jgi:hypothetical protein
MSWRPHGKRVSISSRSPTALAVCDRCGMLGNLDDLVWQYEWEGPQLRNLYLRVHQHCLDVPQEQLRPRILPPDPVPRYQPRPEQYAVEDAGLPAADFSQPPSFNPPRIVRD